MSPTKRAVTHRVEEIMPAFRKALALRAGAVLACGDAQAIVNRDLIERLYDVAPAELVERNGRTWPIWG